MVLNPEINKITLLLSILLIWLQYSLWFGKNGLFDYNRVSNAITIQQKKNIKRKIRNNKLHDEINYFNKDYEFIEESARNELNMAKPKETFYRLVPSTSE